MSFQKTSLNKWLLPLIVSLLLTACGDEKETGKKPSSQVVAKVNGDEISIHQVNLMLNRLGPLTEEESKAAANKILAKLVDLQLLKQKAIENKLDRDPTVVQTIEATKNQILAQAYIEREMAKVSKASAAEVDVFYDEHPELFKERKVFNLQELAIEDSLDKLPEFEQLIAEKKNIGEIAQWLKNNNYKFALNANVRAAEQLPSAILEKLQTLNNGDIFAVPNGQSVNIVSVAASQSQPITKEKATPVIENYFMNKNKKEAVELQMTSLKNAANIEFTGPFSDMELDSGSKLEVDAKAPLEIQPKANAPMENNEEKSSLDKGLAGF
jgi:EpsD family peptidyl-prolyl cis-trans isomerase